MTNRNAFKCTLGVVVAALFLAVTWSTTAARSSTTNGVAAVHASMAIAPVAASSAAPMVAGNLGNARVFSVISLDGGCVFDDDQPVNSVESWDVQQGKTYQVTLTDVTDCAHGGTDATIKVNIKSTPTGNVCLTATQVQIGTYVFNITMPSNACFTYPIVYCASATCTGNDGFFARRKDGGASESHLKAATFDENCQNPIADEDCTTPQGCTISCPTVAPACAPADSCSAVVTFSATSDCEDVVCIPPSGSTFPVGTTTVTCTATDALGVTASCSFDVTINDCQDPTINCPTSPVTKCNDLNQCGANVSYEVTSNDNCSGVQTSCSPQSGSFFPVGNTTVNCTATDGAGRTATCSFTVTVNDCQAPTISCPPPITTCNTPGLCSAAVTYVVGSSDNCQLPANALVCIPPSGSTFPIGSTTVSCTVTDAAGLTASCTFSVTVNDCTTGTISGKKFYDANTNGLDDDGQVVVGWKVVLSGPVNTSAYTDGTGHYSFGPLPVGTYTVTEVFPPGGSWVSSTHTSCTFTISCANASNEFTCDFGNYCNLTPGGLTIGFWSNKNGQALETAADFVGLTALCLKNANGSDRDFTGSLTVNKTNYRDWLLSANATNMAYILSAQLSATYLNVAHGFTNATVVVDGTRTVADEIAYANSLLCGSAPCTGYNGNSTAAGPCRTEQERVKNILDKINNGGSFVQPAPCSFTSPY